MALQMFLERHLTPRKGTGGVLDNSGLCIETLCGGRCGLIAAGVGVILQTAQCSGLVGCRLLARKLLLSTTTVW